MVDMIFQKAYIYNNYIALVIYDYIYLLQMVLVTRLKHRVWCSLVIRPCDLVMSFILLKCGEIQMLIRLFLQVYTLISYSVYCHEILIV